MKLKPHQVEVLKNTEEFNHVAYYLDMGLGKTFVGAEKLSQLCTPVNLLICQKSKVSDWIEHFKLYYPKSDIHDLTRKNSVPEFLLFAGMKKYQYSVGIINYDLLIRRPELKTISTPFTLMLDESSLIQNENSKRSKFILKMEPQNVILLSGTPTGGKYERLWSQLYLLGWKIPKRMFYDHYVDYHFDDSAGFPRMVVDGYKNVDRLKQKMRQHGCVFMKTEDCIDLPEQVHQTVKVPTTKEYRIFKKDRIVTVDGVELMGDTVLKKLLYMRQLCGQYNPDKLQAFRDLLESTEDRVIVFYNFNAELDTLQGICNVLQRPVSVVNGSLKDLTAYDTRNDSVTFVQYQAGAMGLNLQKSCRVIYFTPTLSSELFEQSKKRVHRIGQKRTCFYYYLTSGIEEHIYKILQMRKDYTEELFIEGDK